MDFHSEAERVYGLVVNQYARGGSGAQIQLIELALRRAWNIGRVEGSNAILKAIARLGEDLSK